MNAILVFDPANDLLLVKSSRQFRSKVFAYARTAGLLAPSTSGQQRRNSVAQQTSSSTDDEQTKALHLTGPEVSHDQAAARRRPLRRHHDAPTTKARNRTQGDDDGAPSKRRRRRPTTCSGGGGFEDASKCYTDILMLLLTPYVASLRLSSELRAAPTSQEAGGQRAAAYAREQSAAAASRPPAGPPTAGGGSQAGDTVKSARTTTSTSAPSKLNDPDDLLTKFMSSISINHECLANETGGTSSARATSLDPMQAEGSCCNFIDDATTTTSKLMTQPHTNAHFSTLQMPVECLQDCQVVYCELYDFVFIHFQQLISVSGFKLRLLQRRIDLFARLAQLLFGRALNGMRSGNCGQQDNNKQALLLRRLYDCWFEHQFESQLFLEANERLILGSDISRVCHETLRNLSAELRRNQQTSANLSNANATPQLERHQHALLFSSTKLVSKFSCFNASPLTQADLIMLLILLRAHNSATEDEVCRPDTSRLIESRLYKSRYLADRHTSQIKAPSGPNTRGRAGAWCLPRQMLVFLEVASKTNGGVKVLAPHMLRFVQLTPSSTTDCGGGGLTLILIGEISAPAAYLNKQLSELHSLLLDFSGHSQRPGGVGGCNFSSLAQATSSCKPARLKLGQLARLNDCVSATREFFMAHQREFLSKARQRATDEQKLQAATPQQPPARQPISSFFARYFNAPPPPQQQQATIGEEQEQEQEQASLGISSDNLDNLSSRSFEMQQGSRLALNNAQPSQVACWPQVAILGESERRLCRHLLRKLAELAQNNVQTYMRQTFGLPLDEHKREALVTSVCSLVRQSFCALILEPQLKLLSGGSDNYLRHWSQQVDCVKELAQRELSDYLDYLAVKAQCNVTLGAPLTHDMRSLKAFVYVDRARQELIMSPPPPPQKQQEEGAHHLIAPMSWRELVEGDFEAACERQRRREAISARRRWRQAIRSELDKDSCAQLAHNSPHCASSDSLDESLDEWSSNEAAATSGDDSSDFETSDYRDRKLAKIEEADQADQSASSSDCEQTSGSIKRQRTDLIEATREEDGDAISGARISTSTSDSSIESIIDKFDCANKQRVQSTQFDRSRHLLATSQDVSIASASSSAASSRQSMATGSGGYLNQQNEQRGNIHIAASEQSKHSNSTTNSAHALNRGVGEEDLSNYLHKFAQLDSQEEELEGASGQLMRGFTAFIYNRLAGGQVGSFSQSCKQTHMSYFMWFKRQTDNKLLQVPLERRRDTARQLATHFRSLPNVCNDNFFAQLTGSLKPSDTGNQSQEMSDNLSHLKQHRKLRRRRRVRVECQWRELDAASGLQLGSRRQLTRVCEEEEEEDYQGCNYLDQGRGVPYELDLVSTSSASTSNLTTGGGGGGNLGSRRWLTSTNNLMEEQRDFNSFLRQQQATSSGRKSSGGSSSSIDQSQALEHSLDAEREINCCELFCLHDTRLLLNRDQATIEAQRLAQRLASLIEHSSIQ